MKMALIFLGVFVQTLLANNVTDIANMSTITNQTTVGVAGSTALTTEPYTSRKRDESRTTSTEATLSTLTAVNGTAANESESTTSVSTVSSTPVSTESTEMVALPTAGATTSGHLSSASDAAITVIVTSSMTSPTTSESGIGLMTSDAGLPATISVVVYVAAGTACGLVLLVVVFAVVVWCLKSRKPGRRRRNTGWSFDEDEMAKLHYKDRMSMHRPNSATTDAEDELGFVTFNVQKGEVDGIVNPSYSLPTVSEEAASATIPSHARMSVAEGAAATDKEGKLDTGANRASKARPQSGFSYTSADIDTGLDKLDTDTT